MEYMIILYQKDFQLIMYLGVFLPPIGGIFICDFWLFHRGEKYPDIGRIKKQVLWAGIIAYLLAGGIGFYLSKQSLGITGINEVVISFIAYYVLRKLLGSYEGKVTYSEKSPH